MIFPKHKTKGFSLVELLIVISIIGILSSIVTASLNSSRANARDAVRKAHREQIKLALDLAFDADGKYPYSSGTWKCLGNTPSQLCWKNTSSYFGSDTVNTTFLKYLSTIPKPKAEAGTFAYEAYMYHSNTTFGGNPWGAYLIWYQEKEILVSECRGYLVKHDKYWYCYEYMGSPPTTS